MLARRAPKMLGLRDPGSLRADILMSIKEEHMINIAAGRKNHEYRKYLLPPSVKRIWFYTSYPVASVQYVARISRGKKPGEVPEDGGIGNVDFNAGRKVSKFGYEILRLWRLRSPITLTIARHRGYLKGPPQKYCYAPPKLIEDYPLDSQLCIINAKNKKRKLSDQNDSSLPSVGTNKKIKTMGQGSEAGGNAASPVPPVIQIEESKITSEGIGVGQGASVLAKERLNVEVKTAIQSEV